MAWVVLIVVAALVAYFFIRPRNTDTQGQVGDLSGPGSFSVNVVGESRYQQALEEICGGRNGDGARKNVTALLILEDENPHDNLAVRVDIEGRTVGYLSRATARQYRSRLKEAGRAKLLGRCAAIIVGGWDRGKDDRGHFGVKLDLPVEGDS